MFTRPIICALALFIGLTACSETATKQADITLAPSTTLSFHMVRPESNNEAAMRLALDGKVPPGAIYLKEKNGAGLILERETEINQNCLKKVSHSRHPTLPTSHILNFQFNADCAKIFGRLTSKSIGKRFAVVVNNEIITAPRINSAITGGSGFIEGDFTKADIDALVSDLQQTIKLNKPTQ